MRKVAAHIGLFLVNVIYGVNYSVAQTVMKENYLTPFAFIFLRIAGASVLFWVLHTLFFRERIKRKHIPLLVLCSLFGVVINQLMFFQGLELTTTINASLIMITAPILVLLISSFWLKERITAIKVAGIILGAIGVYFLLGGQKASLAKETLTGDLFILINASSYALYLVLVKPLMKEYHPVTVIKWVFTFGVLPVGLLAFNDTLGTAWHTFTPSVWLRIGYVVVFTTFLAYLLNILALREVNPSVVGAYIYLQPVLTGIIGVLFLGEVWTLWRVAAALCIFAGVLLVSFSSAFTRKPTA